MCDRRPISCDRNGEVLATDVKAPSLFGEPSAHLDKARIETPDATLPDLDTIEKGVRAYRRARGIRMAEERDSRQTQQQDHPSLAFPGIGFRRENKRVFRPVRRSPILIGLVNIGQTGNRRDGERSDNNGRRSAPRRALPHDRCSGRSNVDRPARRSTRYGMKDGRR